MASSSTPYDELPYRSFPIEWTAPERLALASLLHGGPRPRSDGYRVLELGCGDGSNLLPLAYYRPGASFVGLDGAHSRIALAEEKRALVGVTNVSFVAGDFRAATSILSGQFDYIIAHGVLSWVGDDTRDALLALCAERLQPGGLFYVNYNARPGWNVRGLIRGFLLAQTAGLGNRHARAERARVIAARLAQDLNGGTHPYSQLLANEFSFVGENPLSHTAHDYLADDNHAYWRREFLDLVARAGLVYVADADFNYPSGRLPEGLSSHLAGLELDAASTDEAIDLLCYRQVHAPILTQPGFDRRQPDTAEWGRLILASRLVEEERQSDGRALFRHPSGYQVEARSAAMATALRTLQPLWPGGRRLDSLIPPVAEVLEDLSLLYRCGMIDIRLAAPAGALAVDPEPLNRVERAWGEFTTDAEQRWTLHTASHSPAPGPTVP